MFIYQILQFILKLCKIPKDISNSIAIIILIYYVSITLLPVSLFRSLLMLMFSSIIKRLKLPIGNLLLLCITIWILLLLNHYYIYNIGFIYSFLCIFFILVFKIKNLFLFSVALQLFLLPLNIYFNNSVNISSLLFLVVFTLYFTYYFFPLLFLSLILRLSSVITFNINLLLKILDLLSLVNYSIVVVKLHPIIFILFYILYYLIFKYRKYILIVICCALVVLNSVIFYLSNDLIIAIIDVGQGNSILIYDVKDHYVILIDSGGSIDNDYNKQMVHYKILPVLHSLGINKIDLYVASHGDLDHIGTLQYLIDTIKVEDVLINCNEINEYEIINTIQLNNPLYIYNRYTLSFTCTNNQDENNSSIITVLDYNDYRFVTMGDLSSEYENVDNIDFLVLSHHGSKNSSMNVLNNNNLLAAFISVGNNNYGHPHPDVISLLKQTPTYITKRDGTILLYLNKNSYFIKTEV